MHKLGYEHEGDEWRLFADCSKSNIKAVLVNKKFYMIHTCSSSSKSKRNLHDNETTIGYS